MAINQAREAGQEDPVEQNGNGGSKFVVVMPNNPLFDKILTFHLFCLAKKVDPMDVEILLWSGSATGRNRPEEEELQEYEKMGAYLIDIGPRKYTQLGIGSSCELVLRDLGILRDAGVEEVFDLTHQWCGGSEESRELARNGRVRWARKLVRVAELLRDNCSKPELLPYLEAALVASRNNASGYLKQYHQSFVLLLRRLYELEISTSKVIDLIWGPIEVQLRAADPGNLDPNRSVDELLAHPTLGPYFEKNVAGNQFHLFTMARYLRDLWLLGEKPEEIEWQAEEILGYWLGVDVAVQRGRAALALVSEQVEFARGQAVSLSTDNPFVTRAVWRDQEWVKTIMIRKSSGNVTILTRGLYTRDLYRVLEGMEPGLWYHQRHTDTLLNGGLSYGRVKPSALTSELLMELVERHVFKM